MKGRLTLAVGQRSERKAVLRLDGSIDPTTYKQFESTVRWLNRKGMLVVAVDMAKLTYISSAGLSLLVKAQTERLKKKGGVVLVRPQTPILNILKILGLTEVFRIASSIDEAFHSTSFPELE